MSLDYCEQLFREVRQSQTIAEACRALEPLFGYYKTISLGLERGAIFWRARKCGTEPWPNLSEMGAPPARVVATGRLNEPRQPLLYASIKEETALQELDAAAGELVQIVGYRTVLGQLMQLAVIGELMHVYKLGYIRFIGKDPDSTLARAINDLDPLEARRTLYIDAFLHSLLADDRARDNDYMLTRAVAAMVHRDLNIDGIAFQSARDPLGYNITLRSEVVDQKVHATACVQCKVATLREFGFVDFSVLREAIRVDSVGNFEWADPAGAGRRRFFNLTKEEYDIALKHQNDPNGFARLTRAHQ
jgi:hypothetical protein